MKKYRKPSFEYIDLALIGRIMDGLGGGSPGNGMQTPPSGDPDYNQTPKRRVF